MTSRCSCSDGGSGSGLPAASARACEKTHGIPDRAAGHRHAVNARIADHVEAGLGIEQIAAAEHDPFTRHLLELPQEFPPRRPIVALRHRPPVNRNRRDAEAEGAVENLKKLFPALAESSIPRRILTVTGIAAGTASRTRRTISSATAGWLK